MNSRQKSKANCRQGKSNANSRQEKSRANGKQSKPKDCDRDKAKKHSREGQLQTAMQMSSSNPSSQPASPRCSAGQHELKFDEEITTIQKIAFDEEIVECKKIIPKAQKQKFRKSRRP